MLRTPKLPLLPGYSFDREVGQTRFHKSTQFELLRGEVPYMTEAIRPGTGGYPLSWLKPDLYPSIYPRRETKELPGWVALDKQILTFEAYFQQALWEVDKIPYLIRKVKILVFPEDGTIQVNEPRVENSGLTQGTLISRQRIRFPKPMDDNFYELIDFNIGKNVELFGKVFRIVNCDNFTRQFLNRLGIFVGDPIEYPRDLQAEESERKKCERMGKKPRRSQEQGKFLEYDKCILKFYGYWDDRSTNCGFIHRLEIYLYLADDTIEIRELPPKCGKESGSVFLKRGKLPKTFDYFTEIGGSDTNPLLNVFSTGFLKGRYVIDPISSGAVKIPYYTDKDLAIGACLNVYGRKIVLTDCDSYTQEYYRTKYGIDTFTKIETPELGDTVETMEVELPPWNGFGTFEDSEVNCRTVLPEPPKKDFYKILVKGRVGLDSHALRFTGQMLSTDPNNVDRNFLITFFLNTDTISIYERGYKNTGFTSQKVCSQREIFKPDQDMYVSKKPETFQKEDFWVGNTVKLEGVKYLLTGADDYCFRYMELHCNEFPKSNINLILDKIREKLRPIYKEFICRYMRACIDNSGRPEECANLLSFDQLRVALKELLGDDITEHEIITVARHFRLPGRSKKHSREVVMNTSRTECKKKLWYGLDRLRENLYYKDPCCTGYILKKDAYSLCKGSKIPIENELLDSVFEVVEQNECCEICISDLLLFFGDAPLEEQPTVPFNHKREFSEYYKRSECVNYDWIDCVCLLKNIGLEDELNKNSDNQGCPQGVAAIPVIGEPN